MRVLWVSVFWLVVPVLAEARAPRGWKAIEAAAEAGLGEAPRGWEKVKTDQGIRFLGAWQREDGKAVVRFGAFREMPGMLEIMGLNGPGADPSGLPVRVASLKAPLLGMRFWFDRDVDGREEGQRIFWLGKNGGKILDVELQANAIFDPGPWSKNVAKNPDEKALRAGFEAKAAEMTMLLNHGPKIEIDPKLTPPVADTSSSGSKPKFVVEVGIDGRYAVDGVVQDEEVLLGLMKKAVTAEPAIVLHVKAAKEAEFQWVRQLIRLGAKAGINLVAYGVLKEDELKGGQK
ncbi:hypothetical protein V2O64_13700 [Verrucomicrobiaceae bacterium 227]